MVASYFDLAPHHLAPARFGREKHDQVIALANLRFDLAGPSLTDNQTLIDEHVVAGIRQPRKDVTREALVRLGVALVTEEDACSDGVRTASLRSIRTPDWFRANEAGFPMRSLGAIVWFEPTESHQR